MCWVKTEADGNDLNECGRDDSPITGMFNYSDTRPVTSYGKLHETQLAENVELQVLSV